MTAQDETRKSAFWKHKLEFYASSLYEKGEDGSFSIKANEPKAEKNFFQAMDSLNRENTEMFFARLGDPEKAEVSPELQKAAKFLESAGLDKFEVLSEKGSNAVVLRADKNDKYPSGVVVRLCKANEAPRENADQVLQPYRSTDREGVDLGNLKLEILPRVAMLSDVLKQAPQNGSDDLTKNSSQVYKMFMHSMPDNLIDNDVNNFGNIGILPDGTAVNIDGDAIVKKESLKPKKLARLEEMNNDYKLSSDVPPPFQWKDKEGVSKQQKFFKVPDYSNVKQMNKANDNMSIIQAKMGNVR